jgi:hypothetical protein
MYIPKLVIFIIVMTIILIIVNYRKKYKKTSEEAYDNYKDLYIIHYLLKKKELGVAIYYIMKRKSDVFIGPFLDSTQETMKEIEKSIKEETEELIKNSRETE